MINYDLETLFTLFLNSKSYNVYDSFHVIIIIAITYSSLMKNASKTFNSFSTVQHTMSDRDFVINDFSKTKLWHKTISPHSMLIGHAVERGMARVSDPTSTDRTTGHTISYRTVFLRIQHRIVRGKIPDR